MKQPNTLDPFYDYARLADNKRPDGRVVDWDDDDCWITVSFPKHRIEYGYGQCVRINGILHHSNVLSDCPHYLYEGTEEKTYYVGEFSWSSHDGGLGCWVHT